MVNVRILLEARRALLEKQREAYLVMRSRTREIARLEEVGKEIDRAIAQYLGIRQ
jgi:hypothetical protein